MLTGRYSGHEFRKETCKGGKMAIARPRWDTFGCTQLFRLGQLAWEEALDFKNEGFFSRSHALRFAIAL